MNPRPAIELDSLRAQLASAAGAGRFWRSLDELALTDEFLAFVHREFPPFASEWNDPLSRRRFLKLMGASLALAGLGACTKQPLETIVPYVKQPEETIPGIPLFYATAISLGGYATGLLVESHEGRPTKIEGNPDHPSSLGSSNIFCQAALLDLYDPDRAQTVTNGGEPGTWDVFLSELNTLLATQTATQGAGLRLLTEPVSSPTLAAQISSLLVRFPKARWVEYDPLGRENILEGARRAFGAPLEALHHFDKAEVIVSLDSDFLTSHPLSLRYARQFSQARRAGLNGGSMSRFYAIESTPTITGAAADHRLAASPAEIGAHAAALSAAIGIETEAPSSGGPEWVTAAAADLLAHRGASIVIAGESQPPSIHALAHVMNARLGNHGATITFIPNARPAAGNDLAGLCDEMNGGSVDLLVILGGNPVFDAPADLLFSRCLEKVKTIVQLATHWNETSDFCHWQIPAAHFLESWSDARAFDGAASIVQPLIQPLYSGRSAHELLDALTGLPVRTPYEIVREYWRGQKMDLEHGWRRALHDGVIAGTAAQETPANLLPAQPTTEKPVPETGLTLLFRPDPSVLDGRFANNGWLQELGRPFSKIVWDNALIISPDLARERHLNNGDLVAFRSGAATLEAPIWIQPGQAKNCATLHLGNGRRRAGRVGKEVGFNGYPLRISSALWNSTGANMTPTGKRHELINTQHHHTLDGRDFLRVGTLDEFHGDHAFAQKIGEQPARDETLYNPDEFRHQGYAWGMAIDLNACIGCSACIIACQSENNIPVVGRDQVAVSREMHWIRVDSWFEGDPANPQIIHQPVPCMHCENAPCELVCPVGATLHDKEGLNVQVYNRCIGTRYCSNNCPYKVRRFNFLQYSDNTTESLKLMRNPDVTIRSRGVMEKCTYCVQRINAARIAAELQDRPIRDGEITPACAQACPAEAIVFGNIHDPASRVSKWKALPLNYSMMGELNTRPRTTYLAKLRNPSPQLSSA